jgi:peptidoglycan/xylan/chitin deacetylase (PgdA/CDA1 family)
MKKQVREFIAFALLKVFPGPSLRSDRIASVFFHDPSVELFENVIRWLAEKGYRFISTDDLYEMKKTKKRPSNLALITLDDGWRGNLDLVPVIEKHNTPITIFVSTRPVVEGNYWWEFATQPDQSKIADISDVEGFKKLTGRELREKIDMLKAKYSLDRSSMTKEEVKNLAQHDLVTIGSHTVTHPILKNCTDEIQMQELAEAKDLLESWTGKPVHYIAYPNGDYNRTTLRITERLGYRLGFTVEPDAIDIQNMKPLEIPRICVEDNQGYFESISKASGAWHGIKKMRPSLMGSR